MARYLLASSPVHGHVMPMLAIGADLVARGHQVRLLTGVRFADVVAAAGVDHVALPPDADFDDRGLNSTAPRRGTRGLARARMDVDLLFVDFMAAQYRALGDALSAGPVDAVVAENGFCGAVPLLLGRTDRPPVVVCGVVPLMLSSRDAPPFGMARVPRGRRRRDRLQHRLMTALVHRVLLRANQAGADRVLRTLGLGPLPVFVTEWPRLADRLLQLTVPDFEYPRGDLEAVTFVGPVLAPRTGTGDRPPWWGELTSGRPVVHVTQGTFDTGDLDRLVGPACRGLATDDVLVVVSTGGRPTTAVPGPLPANVRVAEYLPYDDLLPHVDVMVTNGGYGGVHHALAHGVPLVVAGDAEENPEIAARVGWSGAGLDLRTGTPSDAEVRRAVRTVLDDPAYRAGAARLERRIGEARPLDAIAATVEALRPRPAGGSAPDPAPLG